MGGSCGQNQGAPQTVQFPQSPIDGACPQKLGIVAEPPIKLRVQGKLLLLLQHLLNLHSCGTKKNTIYLSETMTQKQKQSIIKKIITSIID